MAALPVFVPISFLEGQAGRLFVEFGFVMASAVVISTFVALSLCPVIASRMLRPRKTGAAAPGPGRVARAYGRALGAGIGSPPRKNMDVVVG